MKKLVVAIAALALTGTASAGDYHRSTTLRCSQCHTMHASRQHQFNDAAEDPGYVLADQGVGYAKLLIQDGANETCLACHDNTTTAPDVLGANASSATFNTNLNRSAGALNGTVGAHTAAGYSAWMGHTLGDTNPPPGFVGLYEPSIGEGFNCSNCHAVHGSAAYRNLGQSIYMGLQGTIGDPANGFGTAGPSYAHAANDGTQDVFIAPAGRDYRTNQITFGVGSANAAAIGPNGMNKYCAVCHGQFHGTANTVEPLGGVDFVRHPTSGIQRANVGLIYPAYGSANDQTSLVRPSWVTGPGNAFEVACLTCHKGHGNQRGYGLIYPDGATPPTGGAADLENGNAVAVDMGDGAGLQFPLRQLCITCHPMGR